MSDLPATARTPRWVKVFGAIALALAVLLVVLMLTGGGDHGPGRHSGGNGGSSNHTAPPEHLDEPDE